ncbi:AAA domain-containing [Fusarium acutatum]|uniref:AAA domain-containing n=1 Tax=Fusarium acutatum TaxID=78861 RepID=A0A8H4JE34_9HYPO|nr:AAA domain-containing [Fusarium acutatum]
MSKPLESDPPHIDKYPDRLSPKRTAPFPAYLSLFVVEHNIISQSANSTPATKDIKTSPSSSAPSKRLAKVRTPTYSLPPNPFQPCVLKLGDNLFGDQSVDIPSEGGSMYTITLRAPDQESLLGYNEDFPVPVSSEGDSFGKCHQINRGEKHIMPCDFRRVRAKFPPDQIAVTYQSASYDLLAKYPEMEGPMAWIDDKLAQNAKVFVEGFGMPYANPSHPTEEWLESPDSAPVDDGLMLLDIYCPPRQHISGKLGCEKIRDLLRGPNKECVDALMIEALPVDRKRFHRYLSDRCCIWGSNKLGIGFAYRSLPEEPIELAKILLPVYMVESDGHLEHLQHVKLQGCVEVSVLFIDEDVT